MNNEAIKEINQHSSDALEQWSDIMRKADADLWAYELKYTDEDLLNALYIFNHVAQNVAIKSGFLNEKNVTTKMDAFRKLIGECFGFDTVELTKKVANETKIEKDCV
jgi:hypothetical protein